MTKPQLIQLKKEQDTRDLAAFLAPLLRAGDVICLYGDLGSGKTFFARALAIEWAYRNWLTVRPLSCSKNITVANIRSTILTSTG